MPDVKKESEDLNLRDPSCPWWLMNLGPSPEL
jgi:hypothetical protein